MTKTLKLGAAVATLFIAASIAACSKSEAPSKAPAAAAQKAALGEWGVDTTQGDPSVKPGDDFSRYANGKWLDTFVMPPDLSAYGTFVQLRLDAEADVRRIVEELAAKDAPEGSLEQKVGGYYKSWMNEARLDEIGAAPLKPHFDALYAIETPDDLTKAYASLHGSAPYGVGIIPDPADTTKYIAFVGQSGLGLPDRDYYLKSDERFVQYRSAYKDYISRVLSLAGVDDAEAKADAIIALETKLAEVQWSQEDSRDIQKIYNPMSKDQLADLAPEFNWSLAFAELGLSEVPTFVVAQPSAIDKSAEIFAATPLALIKEYLAFHVIRNHAIYLSSDFDNAHFDMYSKTLRGTAEQRERWKRGVNQIDAGMGEAVGQIYVDRHFPPANKAAMDALVKNLTEAFNERLQQNEWMDDATREQALLKLSTFEPRIGYTEKWTDFTPLEIDSDSLLENAMAVTEFQWNEQVKRLGGPVDRKLWPYPPQTVNASYSPLLNQLTFPAGILQPPFFDPYADMAVNYGAIGAVIGHEMGHGFDDQGRRFDEKGRIRDWWTPAADAAFKGRTDRLGAQYDGYEPIEGLNINGQLTMGENIGDLGGLQMAYAAYHRHLDQCCDGKDKDIDGVTGDQRFFLAWAQVWRAAYRDDEARQRLLTDPHSPPYYRINGVVRNLDAWYDAFGVQQGDALYLPPEERVRIW